VSRVLLVGKGPPDRGGISAFLGSLLESDLNSRHELRLLNLTQEGTPRAGRMTAANVTRTFRDARAVWRASPGNDVVHIHSALVPAVTLIRAGALALVARIRGRRVVLHVHSGLVEIWLRSFARRLLARIALRPVDHVVTMSNPSRDALARALGSKRISVFDNWVDLERFHPEIDEHATPRILYAGLLTPRKGVGDLLKACALLAADGVDHELLIAGGTPDEGVEAEREIRAIPCPTARFLGPLPHESMAELYRAADVFCLPSWWEAMPLSILEAMASGLPVVATRVGDIPRVVEDGATGRLVPSQDPAALATALKELLTDRSSRRRMGNAARLRAEERFGPAATVTSLDLLYKQFGPCT